MSKKIFQYFISFTLIISGFIACEDKEEIEDIIDKNKIVSFEQDTFYVQENDSIFILPIVVPKYVNDAVQLELKVENGTAIRDTNFYIEDLETKIPIGGTRAEVSIEIMNDTLINADRVFYLELVSAEGGGSLDKEKRRCTVIIENDDFLAKTAVSFVEPKVTVREDAKEIDIEFAVLGELEGDAVVTFSADKVGTAKENIHFRIKTKEVELKQGDERGVVTLEIINDDEENDLRYFDLLILEAEGVVVGSDDKCRISILNDDEIRTIEFKTILDSLAENGGTKTIEIDIKGIKYDSPIIEGEVFIDSLINAEADQITIVGETRFKTCGDTTLILTIQVEDNMDYGRWGAILGFRGLKNVVPDAEKREMIFSVLDNERRLIFQETEIDVSENYSAAGRELEIPFLVEGGNVLVPTEVTVKILEDETVDDELGNQYELRTPTITLPVGVDRGRIKLKINSHPSKFDTSLKLGIETTEETTTVVEGTSCIVNIINRDAAVELNKTEDLIWSPGNGTFEVSARNIDQVIKVDYKIVYMGGLIEGQNIDIDIFSSISLSPENPRVEVPYTVSEIDANSGGFIFSIEKVSVGDIVLEDVINPKMKNYELTVVKDIGEIDRTDWTVVSFSDEEAEGEGSGNGQCIHAIDGNNGTFWHSKWYGGEAPYPHWIIYDMQKTVKPKKGYLRARYAADCKFVRYFVGETAEGPWVEINEFDNRDEAKTEFELDSKDAEGRFLRVVIPEEHGKNIASIAELKLLGGIIDHKDIIEE